MSDSSSTTDGYITDVAYLPGYYPAMSPTQIRYVASLNGFQTPSTARSFSYLELGCGYGSTLLTLAASNPHGQFTGVDFMPTHTTQIEDEVQKSNLKNVRVLCADFASMPDDLGKFDFITLHGVYSWVAPELRSCILGIIQQHLKPGGLVQVTYNAMPGWSSLLPVRELLRYFSDQASGNSIQRISSALNVLVDLKKANVPIFHDQPLAAQLIEKLQAANPHYIAHEYLNEHWTAFEFHEVQQHFSEIGLTYAGRLPIHQNFWSLCAQQRFADQFAKHDIVQQEKLKDYHTNTMFRWDIYSSQSSSTFSPNERAQLTTDIFFRIESPTLTLPHTVKYGTITAGINGPPHEELLACMGKSSWSLADLLDSNLLSQFSPETIMEAIDVGVAMKLFRVEGGPVEVLNDSEPADLHDLTVPLLFNQRALRRDNVENEQVGLASQRTHAGYCIGDLHAIVLEEIIRSGITNIEVRLADYLIRNDKHLREHATGRPLTKREELVHATREICGDFCTTILPELLRQGIVIAKSKLQ